MAKYYNKNNDVEEAFSALIQEIVSKDLKLTIEPDKKYVRRTAQEFAEGAKPVRGKSHRFDQKLVSLDPDVKQIAEILAKQQGISLTEWVRASMRKALRDGMDANRELAEPITITGDTLEL